MQADKKSRLNFTLFGGRGAIGASLHRFLEAAGHSCSIIGREDVAPEGASLGHVIYAAGVTGDFRTRTFDTMRAHVARLAEVLERGNFDSLLYLSSTRVYRFSGHGNEARPVLVDPHDPESVYDLSKLAGEALCLAHAKATVRVARVSNVVDASSSRPTFFSTVLRDALRGEVVFRSSLDSERDFLAQADLNAALVAIARSGVQRLYNVAAGVNLSNRAIGEALHTLTSCRVRELAGAPRVAHPQIDIVRIRTDLAFSPIPPLDAVRNAISQAKEHAPVN